MGKDLEAVSQVTLCSALPSLFMNIASLAVMSMHIGRESILHIMYISPTYHKRLV